MRELAELEDRRGEPEQPSPLPPPAERSGSPAHAAARDRRPAAGKRSRGEDPLPIVDDGASGVFDDSDGDADGGL